MSDAAGSRMLRSTPGRCLIAMALILPMGCDRAPPAQPPIASTAAPAVPQEEAALGEPDDARFIGRIWVDVTARRARGSIMVFLPDRTLLTHSCGGNIRISRWGARADRIRWVEDAIPIEATVSLPSADELRLQLAGLDQVQTYIAADETYRCP